MSRATLFLLLAGLFGCSGDPPMTTASTPDTGRIDGELPNVVLLVAERFDPLDLEDPETLAEYPGLARLVSEGSRFASAFGPTSSAEHASRCLRTGMLPGVETDNILGHALERIDYAWGEPEALDLVDWISREGRFLARVLLWGSAEESRSGVDAVLTALFEKLDELGISERTLVVFTSEAAPETEASPLSDEALRVPLVFWLPGRVPADEVRQQLVAHYDIPVTIVDLLGVESPNADGESFARLLTKRRQAWRDHVVFEEAADGEWRPRGRAFRTKAWKYVRAANGTESFYSMRNDPREQDDVLEDPRLAQFLEQNRTRLAEWALANAR